nr:hypothetical protein [Tanacetum cinerariifolium]
RQIEPVAGRLHGLDRGDGGIAVAGGQRHAAVGEIEAAVAGDRHIAAEADHLRAVRPRQRRPGADRAQPGVAMAVQRRRRPR